MTASSAGVEVWRGGINTWQCDEMGHLNVRFYVAIAEEGLAAFAAELGLAGAFSSQAGATLMVREHHMRFLREARAGDTLTMSAGVLAMTEAEARLLLVLRHEDGQPCAALTVTVAHITARDRRPFFWPMTTRQRAVGLVIETPDFAKPRGLAGSAVKTTASLARAEQLGLVRLGRGAILPSEVDIFGRMTTQTVTGRISDSIGRLVGAFRKIVVDHAEVDCGRIGGAVLENRVLYLRWPRAGDRFELRSGAIEVDHRSQAVVHWMLDPETGAPWATASARIITFDLDARKIVPISPRARALLGELTVEELTL